MKIQKIILFLAPIMVALPLLGQPQEPWPQQLQALYDDETGATEACQQAYERLCRLEQQPLNLNTASREELLALPFLTEEQIEGIMDYRHRHGPFLSMNELRVITALDYPQIALLRHFTTVEPATPPSQHFPPLREVLQGGRHLLTATAALPLFLREGDKGVFLGDRLRHDLRYQFAYGTFLRWGLIGAKDAGEPFFKDRNGWGYDHYAYYVQVQGHHRFSNAVIGCYQLSAGMGLVVNGGFSMGKLAALKELTRTDLTLRPHASRTADGYFRGAAATIRLSQGWSATPFVSYRAHDATLNDDGSIRTLVNSGYHRTATEMGKKGNSHATAAGLNLSFRHGRWLVGLTALYTAFDRRLQPPATVLQRRHDAQGRRFVNIGMSYSYRHRRLTIRGETAMDGNGAVATVNSVVGAVADRWRLLLLHRFYSYRYTALYARSLSEGGRVQNEQGLLVGLSWQAAPHWRWQAYIDHAYFPWARYQVTAASRAWDGVITTDCEGVGWRLTGRYRWHCRQQDNATKTGLLTTHEHRGRLTWRWGTGDHGDMSTQLDGVGTSDKAWGWMVNETAGMAWKGVRMDLGAGYFHTTGYDSRLYVYEHGPLYTYSLPMYHGVGLRYYAMVQATIGRRMTVTGKMGCTHYLDRRTSGSGPETVDTPWRPTATIQLRCGL